MANNRWTRALVRAAVPRAGLGNLIVQPSGGSTKGGPKVATHNVTWNSPGQPQILDQDAQAFGEDAYLNQVFVMRCVQTIANTIAGLEFRAGLDPEDPANHDPMAPLAQLLGPATPQAPGGPCPDTSSRAFWCWAICQYMVFGRFAWECQLEGTGKNKEIIALWPLVSDCISAVPSQGGTRWFDSYVYTTPMAGDITLTREQCIYAWRPSLQDWRVPETVLSAAKLPIYIAKGIDRYMVKLLENDMVASTLVVTPPFDEPSARRAWQEQFNTSFSGVDNRGKTIFAEAEYDEEDTSGKPLVQIEKIAQTAVEAELLTLGNSAKDEICVALGVPLSLIGNAQQRIFANAESEYKCLRASEYVRLANGERHQAKDMVGKVFNVLTSSSTGTREVEAAASWQAIEPCYALTTESGRRLEATAKHPLYRGIHLSAKEYRKLQGRKPGRPRKGTGDSPERRAMREGVHVDVRGWTPFRDIEVGDLVAVPTELPMDGCGSMTVDEATVLGAITGDGCVRTISSPVLTTPDGPEVDSFKAAVRAMGDEVTKYKTGVGVCDTWGVRGGNVRKFLEHEGLWGLKGHDKIVTPGVFAARREVQAAYLQALYAADGCASVSAGRAFIVLVSVSHQLVLDVQELLLRFGICARIQHRTAMCNFPSDREKKQFSSYALIIDVAEEVLKFCNEVGIPAKQPAIDAAREAAAMHGLNHSGWRVQQLNPGLRWERVKSIEYVGVDQTVGLEVPDGHTYLGTLWEHNTFWTLTVINLITELQDHVNTKLAPRLGQETGWFDLSRVAALQPPSIFAPPMIGDVIQTGVATAAQIANLLAIPAADATSDSDTDTIELGEESASTGAAGGARSWKGTRVTKHQLINARIRYETRALNTHNWQEPFSASKWLVREHIDVRSPAAALPVAKPRIAADNAEATEILRRVEAVKSRSDLRRLEQRKLQAAELVERTSRTASEVRALAVSDKTAQKVKTALSAAYPQHVLNWVDDADWEGPIDVPLDNIDMARRPGGRDQGKVKAIAQAIVDDPNGPAAAPVMLVKTPDSTELAVADGYHRLLANKRLGRISVKAFVATVDENSGPWDTQMHDAKLNRMVEDAEVIEDEEVRAPSSHVTHRKRVGAKHTAPGANWHNSEGFSPYGTKAQLADHLKNVHGFDPSPTASRDFLDEWHSFDHDQHGEVGAHEKPDDKRNAWLPEQQLCTYCTGNATIVHASADGTKSIATCPAHGAMAQKAFAKSNRAVTEPLPIGEPEIQPFNGVDFDGWLASNEVALLALIEREEEEVDA